MIDAPAELASSLLRRVEAPPARTLIDILRATAERHPDEPAIDDGTVVITYRDLLDRLAQATDDLARAGLGAGDRVGVRMRSGTCDLYVTILAVLSIGAAYVPVDADDPEARASLVFAEANVAGVVTDGPTIDARVINNSVPRSPTPDDDAWIIFTSGSTGVPKGVAVTHRSAAAFVDAEAALFLVDDPEPLGPGDRVLAGLSVAFDASCEEMWLAWRSGACLVPAPRVLVRTGLDLAPWLVARAITVVSTVPTLAGLWPADALDNIRLLIFGGEACSDALAERVCGAGREVWNTYGPTEATVVACAAPLDGLSPVAIGLPLAGWDLAVVDEAGNPVAEGDTGELIIGGVGLARYLDADKDRVRFAAMPTLGWERAYRTGDLVVNNPKGLLFVGRADDQVKLGGRRIELGEIDAALQALPGVNGAAAAVQTTAAGNQVLVGYLTGDQLDLRELGSLLRDRLPAALVPTLAVCESIPTRTSGKVDRNALPWPLPMARQDTDSTNPGVDLDPGLVALAERWTEIIGVPATSADDDFFELGGGSLTAAQLVSGLRDEFPQTTVADVYAFPRLGAMAARLEELRATGQPAGRPWVRRTPRRAQLAQLLVVPLAQTIAGARWATWTFAITNLLHGQGLQWAPTISWWWLALGAVGLITPFGRMTIAALVARILLRGVQPGTYPRGGSVHVRMWAAERFADAAGASNLSCAPWVIYFARALGASVGRGVDLHALPPLTGMLTLGDGASVEPEVDLAGWWLDGDEIRVGHIEIGAGATVGSRSTLLPGARIGRDAEVLAGSAVHGRVRARERWSGSPAERVGKAKPAWPAERPPRNTRWVIAYALGSSVMALLPLVSVVLGLFVLRMAIGDASSAASALGRVAVALPLATIVAFVSLAALIVVCVRALGLGVVEGTHPVRSRTGLQIWATERLLDDARTLLFPLYASLATPTWLRLLGAQIGRGVEASTVLLLPKMTRIDDDAFIADDTMIASYELGGGWIRVAKARVGKRSFLGNSGIAAGGRNVPKNGLVAVLSAAPKKSKAGTSWLGSPPVKLRRAVIESDVERTYAPPTRLRVARALVELCRLVPVVCTGAIGIGVMAILVGLAIATDPLVAASVSGVVLLGAGLFGAALTTLSKWLLVGRIEEGDHALWSAFVWRNEVFDAFVEVVAAPWFTNTAIGTPMLALWLRTLGARIGRGVWCESHWFPEPDLIRLGDGVSVNRGCVLQTHLFHDRVMSISDVDLDHGATIGPHGVILPAASIGADATVGPASLVMRGEHVPARTRWTGNPIGPWKSKSTEDA